MLNSWTWKRVRWSLRKAKLPITSSDLVLDVGSGGSPHPAADVLLEKYADPTHRFVPLVIDRTMVFADACKMPFRDKSFDYIIAFHVLEHMREPALFLNELQRVGKAGYIETPNVLFERFVPYDVHLLEVMEVNNALVINKKESAGSDKFLNNIDLMNTSPMWNRFFYGNPEFFHVRYFWQDRIVYRVVNLEVSCDWFKEPDTKYVVRDEIEDYARIDSLRSLGLNMLKWIYKKRKTNKVNILDLIVCPECHGELTQDEEYLSCMSCRLSYSKQPVIDFNNPIKISE